MRLFITGGTGFVGQHFLRHAIAAGHEVVALRRNNQAGESLPGVRWVEGGLADPALETAFRECSVFVHFATAGLTRPADFVACHEVNVVQSLASWVRAVPCGIRRFVICGSCLEYGRSADRYEFVPPDAPLEPTDGYGSSKAAASIAARSLAWREGLKLAVLRPFHIYGEGDSGTRFWTALRTAALRGDDFPMTAGEQLRDFVPIEDVVEAFLQVATQRLLVAGQPEVHNIGTGRPQRLVDFARHWWERFQARGRLLPGAVPYRPNEPMRLVPKLTLGPT